MSYKESYNITEDKKLKNLRIKFEKAKSENIHIPNKKSRYVVSFMD